MTGIDHLLAGPAPAMTCTLRPTSVTCSALKRTIARPGKVFVKDSDLVAAAAQECGAEVPLLAVANKRYRQAADLGLGHRDDSRVIETWNWLRAR